MKHVVGRLVTALGLVALTVVGTAGSAGAADAAAGPTAAAAQAGASIELVGPPVWVHEGEPFEAQVRVTGAPAGAAVDMVVHDAVETRRRFQETLDGELTEVRFELPEQPAANSTVTVGFTPDEDGRRLPGRGVYPVEVRLRAGGETLDSVVTYLSFLNAATPEFVPLDVAVLVDVGAAPAMQPDGANVLPDDAMTRVAQRMQVLDQADGVPLTLAPLPETVEALADGGGGQPAADALEQLRRSAQVHPVFARPFVDVDLVALDRAGLLLEANAQADGGANVVRTRLGVEPTGGMWMSGGNFGARAARVISDLGIRRVVVPPAALEGGSSEASGGEASAEDDSEVAVVPLTPVALGEGGPAAMVTDPLLAGHLVDSADDGMVTAHRFVAELASIWMEAPANPRGIVVHLPPDVDVEPEAVAAALEALADGQAARAVPVDAIFTEVPPLEDGPASVTLAPQEPTDDLSTIAPALREARGRVAGVGALLGDPRVTTDLEQSLLVSTGRDTPSESREAYVGRAHAELGLVADAVDLPDEFRITLTSRSSKIPVQVTNTSDQALLVRLTLDSDQLEFPDGEVISDVALEPGSTTRVEVPVRSRTSGAFSLDITVTSPDGSIVLDRSRFDVRSTAISGVGLVLSVGACLFLAVWWARHWRSVRRSRHLMPAGSVPSSPGGMPVAGSPEDPWAEPGATGPSGPPTADAADAAAVDAVGPAGEHAADPAAPGKPPPRHGRPGSPDGGPEEPYRPAHMARQRTRSG